LARYTGVDAVVFRVVLVVATILGGAGLVAYLVAWVVIPEEATDGSPSSGPARSDVVAALVLGGLGLVVLGRVVGGWDGDGGLVVLVALGALLWFLVRQGDGASGVGAASPLVASAPAGSGGSTTPPTGHHQEVPDQPASTPARARLPLIVVSLLLLLWGLAALWEGSGAGSTSLPVVLGLSTVVVGIGLVVGAWYDRTRGLIALGVVLLLASAVTSLVDAPVGGGFGQRLWAPTTAAEVRDEYRLTAGEAVLDLSGLTLTDDLDVTVRLGAGQLEVVLPSTLATEVEARVALGELNVLGHEQSGSGNEWRATDGDAGDGPTIRLRVRIGVGELEVLRAAA
jgi:hypothetical protein